MQGGKRFDVAPPGTSSLQFVYCSLFHYLAKRAQACAKIDCFFFFVKLVTLFYVVEYLFI